MNQPLRELVDKAAELIHPDFLPVLERLVHCEGGERYLRQKIVGAPDEKSGLDHGRVLKYANLFLLSGAVVAFVPEDKGAKTPDLKVTIENLPVYIEVRKFRISDAGGTAHPVSKIVDAVRKRRQLPASAIGFIAIDNFDLNLESDGQWGLTYDHISEALREFDRATNDDPAGWHQPAGVIIHAHTSGGASSLPISIPHFVWRNEHAEPESPNWLIRWIAKALPDGEVVETGHAAATPAPPDP